MSDNRPPPWPCAAACIIALLPLAFVVLWAAGTGLYGVIQGAMWTVAVLVEVAR